MSKRDRHIRDAENYLAAVDDVIQKFSAMGKVAAKETVAITTWHNTLTNAARAHTALAEHYALWENDDA